MDLRTIRKGQATIGVAIGIVLSEQLSAFGKDWIAQPGGMALFTMLVIALTALFVDKFASTVFDHSQWLRRVLLGRQYIEGIWFDIMRVQNQTVDIGVSRFEYGDYEVKYSGQDWDQLTNEFVPFKTEMLKLEWPRLSYTYTAVRRNGQGMEDLGYGKLDFHVAPKHAPVRHTGRYFAFQENQTRSFEGFRLDKTRDKKELKLLKDPATERMALLLLYEKYGKAASLSVSSIVHQPSVASCAKTPREQGSEVGSVTDSEQNQ